MTNQNNSLRGSESDREGLINDWGDRRDGDQRVIRRWVIEGLDCFDPKK